MVLISACLLGLNCKYNGQNNLITDLNKLPQNLVPVCPEQLGGLPTPRHPAEIVGGDGYKVLEGNAKVMTKFQQDVTDNFTDGAYMTLEIAAFLRIKSAILKSNSPSCGFGCIYDGTFSGKLKKGNGVTAALLYTRGIRIITEKEF